MIKNIFLYLIPNFDFVFLQCLAITLIAILLPKLKINSLLGPVSTVLSISWFNKLYWDNSLFFQLPDSFSINIILLILINSVFLYIIIKLVPGIEISGLPTAIYTSLMFTCCSYLIGEYKDLINWEAVIDFIITSLGALKSFFMNSSGNG